MTMTETNTAARLAVVSSEYPRSLRPQGSADHEFWSGDEEQRTFFALTTTEGDSHSVLVVKQDDPRSLYMRGPESMDENEKAALSAAGLDPFEHKVWTIDYDHIAYVDEVPDFSGVPMLAIGVGEEVKVEVLRSMPGILFRRGGDGLWVSHGDGTATQIENDPVTPDGRRMGIGDRHPDFVPDNSWVGDGWTFVGFDLSRVPADPEVTEPTIENLANERAAMEAEVERLTAEVARLTASNESKQEAITRSAERLSAAQSAHYSDIEKIGDRLIEECENRSWCEEYDKVVSDLNGDLNVPLREREREFSVTLDVTVRVTRTVEATSADAAGEIAAEGLDMEDVRYGDIEETEVYEVEES